MPVKTLALAAALVLAAIPALAQTPPLLQGDPPPAAPPPAGPPPAAEPPPAGGLYRTISGVNVFAILSAAGHRPQLKYDKDGDPEIDAEIGGAKYSVLFYGCDKAAGAARRCRSFQFYAGFRRDGGYPHALANAYNEKFRFGAASVGDNGAARLRLNVNVDGGITAENIRSSLNWWIEGLRDYKKHIGWQN
jgi:hypothetical protein